MTSSRSWPPVAATVATAGLAWLVGRGSETGALAGGLGAPFLIPAVWVAAVLATRARRAVMATALIGAGAAVLVAGWPAGGTLAGFVAAGLVGGWALGRGVRVVPCVGLTALCLVPGYVLDLAGMPPPAATEALGAAWREQYATDLPAELPAAERTAALAAFDDMLAAALAIQRRFWPSLVAAGLVVVAGLALGLGWGLARLCGADAARPRLGSFATWRAPFASVWLLIGGLALGLSGLGAAALVGWNVVLTVAVLLAVQGLAVQAWLIRRVLAPAGQTIFWVFGTLFLAPVLVGGGALVGLVDQWWDLRRLRRPSA